MGLPTPSLQYSDPFLSFCIDLVIFKAGKVSATPMPPATLATWPSTSHSRSQHCKLISVIPTNDWHSFSQNSQKWWPNIWWDGLYGCVVLCLNNFHYLKREPLYWDRQCGARGKVPSEMKDLLPSLICLWQFEKLWIEPRVKCTRWSAKNHGEWRSS